jgi:hypothetical protein
VYQYTWLTLSPSDTVSAILSFQTFGSSILNDIDFGGEIYVEPGLESNTFCIQFFGAYYGEAENFNKTVQPFLGTMPEPSQSNLTRGDYITGLGALALGPMNVSSEAPTRENFYTKSLMTPEDKPMTENAVGNFIQYLLDKNSSFPEVRSDI